jgi:DNA-binding response OmpR family regulator
MSKILIIDSEKKKEALFRDYFKKAGYEVKILNDGQSALKFLTKHRNINLIVLNMVFPKMKDLYNFRMLKKKFPWIRIIVSSNFTESGQKYMAWDADDYYYKLKGIPVLIGKVKKLLKN